MKKILLLFSVFMLSMSSCDKLFLDVEGFDADLQGKWQLTSDKTTYYNFQNSLFQYQLYYAKDSMAVGQGYYTLYGDTAMQLELDPDATSSRLLKIIKWDTLDTGSPDSIMLYRRYRIKGLENNRLSLEYKGEKLTFQHF